MASSNQKSNLAAKFTLEQQALISEIVKTEISELIACGGLVCSHCSSSSQVPWLPADSKVAVPTTLLQAYDKQFTIFKRQLSEQATKLQQFIGNNSCSEPGTSNPSTNGVAANPSANVEQRLTGLEYRFKQLENLVVQMSKLDPKSENVDFKRLLDDMHANFETSISKLQLALQQTISNQQWLVSTDCSKHSSNAKLAKFIITSAEQSVPVEVKTDKLQDITNLTDLHSVLIDRHKVLSILVSSIVNEHNELAEFVRQLSQSTALADNVVELKAIVECMAKVTGVSEHKAEQLITDFISREGVELEHLKRELRLADDKIRELLLAKNQMTDMHDSAYQNQLPYLNVVTETMQRECERYKRDLNAMADRLSERLNAKVAQAIQQSLVDRHQQNDKAQFSLPSTKGQNSQHRSAVSTRSSGKISTVMLQQAADDGSTVIKVAEPAATAALQNEPEFEIYQNTLEQVKHIVLSSLTASAEMPSSTSSSCTRMPCKKQLFNLNKPMGERHDNEDTSTLHLDSESVSKLESPFGTVAEQLSVQQLTTTQQQQLRLDYATRWQSGPWPVINCVVVGHESAQTRSLIRAYAYRSYSIITCSLDGKSVEALVTPRCGTGNCKLRLANCIEANKLEQITVCDIIVICFSVIDEESYQEVRNVWLKQINKVYPCLPYLLVGTQIDKREKTGIKKDQAHIEYMTGFQLSENIEAVKYFECSDLDVDEVVNMFKYAMQHVIDNIAKTDI